MSAFLLCAFVAFQAHAAGKRALLIGINDYSASHWPNLAGPVTDVLAMKEVLIELYGFRESDILTLTDQRATRIAILHAIHQHLIAAAEPNDVLFFYFAGHGSQVRNSLSDEPDKLDESLVPADSRRGADDIRDKELRRLFNRMLDRGAKLTVFLDHCHSGSGARGLPSGAQARGVALDPRDVRDGSPAGPRPEDRGALVLAAAQDFDAAWETRGADGVIHGAFSWAWLRAVGDAAPHESAIDTFLRAQARMRAETPYQDPVIAGNDEARFSPFLGERTDRRDGRTVVAVERVRSDGTLVLRGGWANGLSAGSTLRSADGAVVAITAIQGLTRSEGRIVRGATPRSGSLLEVAGWAAPPGRPLRVWAPVVAGDLTSLARAMQSAAAKRRVQWLRDPFAITPTHILRRNEHGWELLSAGTIEPVDALAAIAKLPARAKLFVQFPATFPLGVISTKNADDADYVLAGRYVDRRMTYAWVRPSMNRADARKSPLPLHTAWTDAPAALRHAALRLERIHAWHVLESPPDARSPYRLGIRRARDGAWMHGPLAANEQYGLALRAASSSPSRIPPRHFYVFAIDSDGESTLLFPQSGSVENRFPLDANVAPPVIPLGPAIAFETAPPYGVDTYVLLSTDEPLPNPWILEWEGVRSTRVVMPASWSIERVVIESLPPREKLR